MWIQNALLVVNAGLLWRYTSETVKIRQATQRQSELADAQLQILRSQLKHRDDAGLAALKESIAGVDKLHSIGRSE